MTPPKNSNQNEALCRRNALRSALAHHGPAANRHSDSSSKTRLRLRVSPGADRSALVGRHGDGWKFRVAAAPEGGRANDSLVGLLAALLDLRRPDVRIVSGTSSRDKVVELVGLTRAEVERRLIASRKGTQ